MALSASQSSIADSRNRSTFDANLIPPGMSPRRHRRSTDSVESHQQWINSPRSQGGLGGLAFPLASDLDGSVSKAYGVYKEKKMYGKKYWGIERSTFVIDPNGKLKAVFRKVKVDGHVDEVLTALRSS